MIFRPSSIQKAIACLLSAATLAGATAPSVGWAANNRLTNIARIPTTDGSVMEALDLTLNTDWDFDAGIVQSGTGTNGTAARVLDRGYVEALVRQTARTLFVMTNGRHRIGKVYIFKNSKFGNDVDIRLMNVPGRANASVAGWKAEGGLTTNNYITNRNADGSLGPETPQQTGEVVAHELGHYVYGLLDEYREAGKACLEPAKQLGSPCQDDTPKPTVMNDQAASYRLSVPADYAGQPAYRTAQARGYGKADGSGSSAWEMLVSDPAGDSAGAKEEHGGRRIRFDAFKDAAVPALTDLKQFSVTDETRDGRFASQLGAQAANSVFAGYDSQLQLVFEEGGQAAAQPRNVIIIDRTAPDSNFQQFIAAAQGLVNRAPANARFALVASPAAGAPQFFDMDATGKGALKAALEQLRRVDDGLDLNAAYEAGKALVTAARAAGGTANAADIDTFSLYTLNTTAVPGGLGATARNDKIAINVVGFRAPAERSMPASSNSLASLARLSGGANTTAKSANEAIKEADKAFKDTLGETESLIVSDLSDDTLAAGTTHDVRFKAGPVALDGTVVVTWYFEKADQGRLRFSCISAANGQTVPAVVQDTAGSDEGQATCTLGADRTVGEWIARTSVAAGTGAASGVETEAVAVAAGQTPVDLDASVEGGIRADNRSPMLSVKLAGAFPIIKSKIQVGIFDAMDGRLVKQFVLTEANDAGTGVDARAGDGIYTLDLAGQLPAGNYVAVVDAATDGSSQFNPVQRFIAGDTLQATSVGGEIARQAEVEFTLEAGAAGVGSNAAESATPAPAGGTAGGGSGASGSSGGGGGCTVGGGSDAGLLLLLGIAAARLMLRRGRRQDAGEHGH